MYVFRFIVACKHNRYFNYLINVWKSVGCILITSFSVFIEASGIDAFIQARFHAVTNVDLSF